MSPLSLRPNGPLVIGLVMGALLACRDDGDTVDDQQLREDVLYCEDAIGHLEECCPGFVAEELACVHYKKESTPSCGDGAYSTTVENPALDLAESQCIRARSCEQLVAAGVCTRAQAARAQRSGSSSWKEGGSVKGTPSTYSTAHERVCP